MFWVIISLVAFVLIYIGFCAIIWAIIVLIFGRGKAQNSYPMACPKCGSKCRTSISEERSRFYGRTMGYYVMTVEAKYCAECGEELYESDTGTGGYWM